MENIIRRTLIKREEEMIEVLIRFLSKEDDADKNIKVLKKITNAQDGFVSRVLSLFATFFIFGLLMFFSTSAIVLVGFLLIGEIEEDLKIFFIIGSVMSIVFSFLFYKLMKKAWGKLKQPTEKELSLKI